MPRALLLIAVGVAATCSVLLAQERAAGPASPVTLGGVVVNDDAAAPLRRVRVEVSAAGLAADPVFTDAEGRFAVSVPRTPHTITFYKAGFVRRQVQRSTASIDEPLTVAMTRGAAIAGRVVDLFGDPLIAHVTVRSRDIATRVSTDPLGEFHVGNLPAGRYELAAAPALGFRAAPDSQPPPAVLDLRVGEEAILSLRTDAIDLVTRAQEAARLAAMRAAQPSRPGESAGVRGRVTGPDGLPVGGAVVTVRRQGERDRSGITDGNGQYAIDALPPGAAVMSVFKIGPSFMGARDVPVDLRPDQVVDNVDLTLRRNPVVEGVVTDGHGEPVEGATVQLWHQKGSGGRTALMPLDQLTTRTRTDDRGRYRLLAWAGTWYVVATDQESPPAEPHSQTAADGPLRVYYPGTAALAEATALRVEEGRDMAGIDITLAARAGGRVQGFAFDASGRPLTSTIILMDRYRPGVPTPSPRSARIAADGRFVFTSVPAGDHVLHAIVSAPGGRAVEFAMAHVTVSGGDAAPVVLRTAAGTTLAGRIVLEGRDDQVDVRMFALFPQGADGDSIALGREASRAIVGEDGTFEMAGLFGPLRVVASPPPGWWLKSLNIGAVDLAEQPFLFGAGAPRIEHAVAVFADTAAGLTGHVVDRGERVSAYAVLVFSTDPRRWWASSGHVRLARADRQGQFRALALPPGEYFAVAVDRFDPSTGSPDAELLAELAPVARRVTLGERQQAAIELDLIRRPR